MIEKILRELRNNGARITPARKAIIKIIFNANMPVDALSIQRDMATSGTSVNKTTVYRELDFLLKEGVLKMVYLKPGIAHYESAYLAHHHHLVCTNCENVEEIDCVIDEESLERKLKKKHFSLDNHKFELYGRCVNCA